MTRRLDWFLAVARGDESGAEAVHVHGQNPDVDTGTLPEDVWDGGGTYTYPAAGGAQMYISSSNGGDTQAITVNALVDDGAGVWTEESKTVTLQGQTKTTITFASGLDPVRILSVVNASGTVLAGDCYVYENSAVAGGVPSDATKIRAKVIAGNDTTLMAMYTVPSSKTAYLYRRQCGLANATATTAEMRYQVRLVGGAFTMDARQTLDNSVISERAESFQVPIAIPAKTDIKWTAQVVGADNSAIAASFDLIVIG